MEGQHQDRVNQGKTAHTKPEAQSEAESTRRPFRLEDADVMDLQRHLGNQATQSVLGVQRKPAAGLPSLPGIVQTKLSVNQPGDQYEQEADSVAHEVMTMPDPVQREPMPEPEDEEQDALQTKSLQREEMPEEELQAKRLQRQEMPEEEEMAMTKRIQREPMPEPEEELQAKRIQREEMPEEDELQAKRIQRQEMPEEDELAQAKHISSVQRASDVGVPPVTDDMESQIEGAKGGGQVLPEQTRDFLEPRFGQDFSNVRVHTGAESNDLNNNLQARAFTTGSDIFFRDGDYSPDSDGGRELLAHELTHVVQQGGSKDLQTKKDED